jgi:hypothetical protein
MPSRAIAVAPLRKPKAALVRLSKRCRRTKIGPIHVTYALTEREVGHPVRQTAHELSVGAATVDRMLRHSKQVDPGLLNRLLQQLRLQRALALATIA